MAADTPCDWFIAHLGSHRSLALARALESFTLRGPPGLAPGL